MRPYLTEEQERYARERVDISEPMFAVFVTALLLVAAFCFYMVFSSGS